MVKSSSNRLGYRADRLLLGSVHPSAVCNIGVLIIRIRVLGYIVL